MKEIIRSKIFGIKPGFGLEKALEAWAVYLAEEDIFPRTITTYRKGVRKFASWLEAETIPFNSVNPDVVRAWRNHLKKVDISKEDEEPRFYTRGTINLWLTAVRRFYAWLIEQGLEISNPAVINPAKKSKNGENNNRKRQALTSGEVCRILATCDDTPIGVRDRAILSLMAYAAVRSIEIRRANLKNLETDEGRLKLWVQGKGRPTADEFVVISPACEEGLGAWLALRGNEPGALFTSFSNRSSGERLSLRAIRRTIALRFKKAGVVSDFKKAGVVGNFKTVHSLRHTAVTNAIRRGANPLQVQKMARHKDINTTLGYYHDNDRLTNPAEDFIDYSNGLENDA